MDKINLLEVILLFISLTSGFFAYKLKKILNNNNSKEMNKEAQRILFDNAKDTFDGNYPLDYRIHTKGLALIKDNKTNKYNLISQIKVSDIGLY